MDKDMDPKSSDKGEDKGENPFEKKALCYHTFLGTLTVWAQKTSLRILMATLRPVP